MVEVSRSHSDTLHSVGLLWTSDRPFAEAFYLITHAGFEPAIPASERQPTQVLERGHRNRPVVKP